jgi:hypothetical protein
MTPETDVLDEIGQLYVAELESLPLTEIDQLLKKTNHTKETARHYEQLLQSELNRRFAERAHALRKDEGKDTGRVRFANDGYVVIADLPKRTEYDQPKLRDAVEALHKWGEDPNNYVGIEVTVSESKYNAWPPAVRALFEPARTLKTGKPNYKLEKIDVASLPPVANDPNFNGAQ